MARDAAETPNRRALRELRGAYARLNDGERTEEMVATITLFERVSELEGDHFAREWVARPTEQVRRERDAS